ncbi:hypothetical protein GGF31_003515 [Allomyces arbusculus]|nr:hypothetical protein GGF31_003515 [Allomyces arbusculus]
MPQCRTLEIRARHLYLLAQLKRGEITQSVLHWLLGKTLDDDNIPLSDPPAIVCPAPLLAHLVLLPWHMDMSKSLCVYVENNSAYLLPKHVRLLARVLRLKHLDAPILKPYRSTTLRFPISDDDDDDDEDEVHGEDDVNDTREDFEEMLDTASKISANALSLSTIHYRVLQQREEKMRKNQKPVDAL